LKARRDPPLKTYNSFGDAQEVCGMGYEDKELVDVIVAKTVQNRHLLNDAPYFNNATLSSLTSLLYCLEEYDSVNVVDLGGSTGLQYHIVRDLIVKNKKINWHVVESTALVEKSRSLFSTDELSFSDNLEKTIHDLKEIHLVHCSGVIQYMPDPYGTLEIIAASNARYLVFARMCFSKKANEVIIVQQSALSSNGFGPLPASFKDRTLSYPQTSIKKEKFLNILKHQYETVFSFQDDSGVHYPAWQEGLGVFMKKK
jgi:putative methyltransferase (TIGR04325 family)